MQAADHSKPDLISRQGVRRHPRSPYSVPIMFHGIATGVVRTARGVSLDISEGGVGALVEGRLQVGETGALDVPLPEHMLSAVAVVRHSSSASSGFEFVGLTPEERSEIQTIARRG